MQDFREIKVWRRAHAIALRIYTLTGDFPDDERFGVVQQLKRAAVSVPTNIAEGSKRLFRRDYVRFLNVAEGSLREVEYLLELSRDLGFGDRAAMTELLAETALTAGMLASFRRAVQRADARARRESEPPTPNLRPDPEPRTREPRTP